MKIGFIGLGSMGRGMAASLLRAGHDVRVYNRTADKARALAGEGATVAGSIAEACAPGTVVTMLANDAAVESVALGDGGIVASLGPGGLHVSSSTIGVGLSKRLEQAHARAGQRFIAAPVFGRPDVAARGQLLIAAAGAEVDLEAATPIFDAVGRKAFFVSHEPSAANLVKLAGNFLSAALIESLGESMALVERGGVGRQRFLEVMLALFDSPPFRTYGTLIAEQRYEPAGFAAPLGQKDIRLALDGARDLGLPMPLAELLRERFAALLASGGEHLDWAAIAKLAAQETNPEPAKLHP